MSANSRLLWVTALLGLIGLGVAWTWINATDGWSGFQPLTEAAALPVLIALGLTLSSIGIRFVR